MISTNSHFLSYSKAKEILEEAKTKHDQQMERVQSSKQKETKERSEFIGKSETSLSKLLPKPTATGASRNRSSRRQRGGTRGQAMVDAAVANSKKKAGEQQKQGGQRHTR